MISYQYIYTYYKTTINKIKKFINVGCCVYFPTTDSE